jgi:hypothetical protein
VPRPCSSDLVRRIVAFSSLTRDNQSISHRSRTHNGSDGVLSSRFGFLDGQEAARRYIFVPQNPPLVLLGGLGHVRKPLGGTICIAAKRSGSLAAAVPQHLAFSFYHLWQILVFCLPNWRSKDGGGVMSGTIAHRMTSVFRAQNDSKCMKIAREVQPVSHHEASFLRHIYHVFFPP